MVNGANGVKRRLETFPGAAALKDLSRCVGDRGAASRVLARYAVARVTYRTSAGIVAGHALRRDLDIAAEYVDAITPADDSERQTLHGVLELLGNLVMPTADPRDGRTADAGCQARHVPDVAASLTAALSDASREAEKRSGRGGALAFELASRRMHAQRSR